MKIGFLGLLTLIFVIAKLAGPLAGWSWLMVLSPAIVGAVIGILIFAVIVTLKIIAES